MKIEAGKTYVDGYNRKVRIVCTDRKCSAVSKSCIGLVSVTESEVMLSYYPDGGYGADYDPKLNLVKEYKEPSYTWINVYANGRSSYAFVSRDFVDKAARMGIEIWGPVQGKRIGLIRVDTETGQADNVKLEA